MDIEFNEPSLRNKTKKQVDKCKGYIYKADVGYYRTQRGFANSVKMNLMKRISCTGCDNCGWFDEMLGEISDDWPVVGMEKVEHGKLYKLEICNETKDWESGHIDGYDLGVVEYIPEDKEKKA